MKIKLTITGYNGSDGKTYRDGEIIEGLEEAQELVNKGYAVVFEGEIPEQSGEDNSQNSDGNSDTNGTNEVTLEQLNKLDLEKLKEFATSKGVKFNPMIGKEKLLDKIINFQPEQSGEDDEI